MEQGGGATHSSIDKQLVRDRVFPTYVTVVSIITRTSTCLCLLLKLSYFMSLHSATKHRLYLLWAAFKLELPLWFLRARGQVFG